ncbi:MAG: matrixin family metalloprotease [Actinomycetales bacterium]|nr:matrixin family metalloprotease [Actinomycetales bacterium]
MNINDTHSTSTTQDSSRPQAVTGADAGEARKPCRTLRTALAAVARTVAGLLTFGAMAAPAGATTASYALSYQSLTSSSNVVMRWNPCQASIAYRVNLAQAASTSTGRAAALKDVKGAIARLSTATGIHYRYLGTTTRIPTGVDWWRNTGDAELIVAWVNQSSSAYRTSLLLRDSRGWLSGTAGWQSWRWGAFNGQPAGAAIVRGYVVLNAAQRSQYAAGFGAGRTRGELLIHELGHTVGLNHVSPTSQIMYPYMIKRSSANYASGDRAGLAKVGRPAGCISIPAWSGAPKDL